VASDEVCERLGIVTLDTQTLHGGLKCAEQMIVLDVEVRSSKLPLVTSLGENYILIHLTNVLRTTKTDRRIRGVEGPVTREGNGIATNDSGRAGKHKQARSDGSCSVRRIVFPLVVGKLCFRHQV